MAIANLPLLARLMPSFTHQTSFIYRREKIYARLLAKFKTDNGVEPTEAEIVPLRKQAAEIADQIIGASVPGRGHTSDTAQSSYSLISCSMAIVAKQ